jgi:hypothetical protein
MQYRRKPIPLDAIEVTLAGWPAVGEFLGDALVGVRLDGGSPVELTIRTLEGQVRAGLGDWVVKGVRGEVWPVRGDIFAETYEPVPAGGVE